MYSGLAHAHSGLRWLVLVLLVAAIITAFSNFKGNSFEKRHKITYLLALVFTHIQLLIGLALYLLSPKVIFSAEMMSQTAARFYTIEHLTLMLLSIVLITVGYSRSKRSESIKGKHTSIAIFYLLGLIAVLLGIPWPFREALGAGWF
jgi:DMSO/TMAO reductase YedYZ heme-binding membrane subunit